MLNEEDGAKSEACHVDATIKHNYIWTFFCLLVTYIMNVSRLLFHPHILRKHDIEIILIKVKKKYNSFFFSKFLSLQFEKYFP